VKKYCGGYFKLLLGKLFLRRNLRVEPERRQEVFG